MFYIIKQLEEKNVSNEIQHMVWNDRMDLVAYSTVKGEVALHRLTWTRAWNIPPYEKDLTVTCLCWRPDGKVLAIGYSNGEVSIVSIENKAVCKTVQTNGNVSCIHWVQEKIENKKQTSGKPSSFDIDEEQFDYMKFIDFSSTYLPDPPMTCGVENLQTSEDNQTPNILHQQSEMNILFIGTKEGIVHVNIFGVFPCAEIDVSEHLGCPCSILNISLTEDFSQLLVIVKDVNNNVKIVVIDSNIFKVNTNELFAIALKYVRITYLIEIISESIRNITETWESILLEMDNKLSKFASQCPGGVTSEFLDLLMFGIYSSNMEEFLMQDLTMKGLERFGQTIEMSYSTIQELLLKYVTKYSQCITYHLAELRGMVRSGFKYSKFGLQENDINEGILSSGAFLIKTGEMHQIINYSIINYKAFFRWLYISIMNLREETIPSEIPKMTQQDLAHISEFFQNFDHIGADGKKGFIMERLGQYLADAPLTQPPKMEDNEWFAFLSENNCLRNDPSILKHNRDYSLIQQFNSMKDHIGNLFLSPKQKINSQIKKSKILNCFNSPSEFKISVVNLSINTVLFSFLRSEKDFILLEIYLSDNDSLKTQSGTFRIGCDDSDNNVESYALSDLTFYSPSILSVLMQDVSNHFTILYQFPVPSVLSSLVGIDILKTNLNHIPSGSINGAVFGPKIVKNIDMIATQLAVSGSRKVGIVLSENKRKIRLFEMEGEEDDEDADMSVNTISPKFNESDSIIDT